MANGWNVQFYGDKTYIRDSTNRRIVEVLAENMHVSEEIPMAHMISAVPELYNALELLLSARCGSVIEKKAIKLAQAALAKARGEES